MFLLQQCKQVMQGSERSISASFPMLRMAFSATGDAPASSSESLNVATDWQRPSSKVGKPPRSPPLRLVGSEPHTPGGADYLSDHFGLLM